MKTFGAPVVAANIGGNSPAVKEWCVRGTTHIGAEIGGAVGAGIDSLAGLTDEGLFTAGLSSASCKLGGNLSDLSHLHVLLLYDSSPVINDKTDNRQQLHRNKTYSCEDKL